MFEVVTLRKSPISAINKIKKHSAIHRQSSRYSFLFSGDENCVKPREEKKRGKKKTALSDDDDGEKKGKRVEFVFTRNTEKKRKSMPSYAAAVFSASPYATYFLQPANKITPKHSLSRLINIWKKSPRKYHEILNFYFPKYFI